MYKMLVVDDEYCIREGLMQFDWPSLDIEYIDSCEHGIEACKWLSENYADIVLTDIRMPIMDGLELLEHINKHYPNIKVVVLTGHDDFNYVRTSLRYGAVDYLLKPIAYADIKQTFEKVTKLINEDEKQENKVKDLEIKNNIQIKLLRNKYLRDLIFKKLTTDEIDEICEYCEILLDSSYYTVFIMRMDQFSEKKQMYKEKDWKLLLYAVCNILTEVWEDKDLGYFWIDSDSADCYLIATNTQIQKSSKDLEKVITKIKIYLYKLQGLLRSTISVGVGTTIENKEGIFLSCNYADVALSKRNEDDSIIIYDVTYSNKDKDVILINQNIHLKENMKMTCTASGKLIVEMAKKYIDENYMELITLSDVAAYVHVNASYLSYLFKEVDGMNFIHYITNIRVINAAKLLKEPQYKIYEVSEMVGYKNQRYFSEIFKKYTGQNPYEYRNTFCVDEKKVVLI